MTKVLKKELWLIIPVMIIAMVNNSAAADTLAYEIDKDSGLIMAPSWDDVKNNCTVCHSAKLITGQRGDRETWKSMIRWMQSTHGLWQIPDETENSILDYLSTNYPPSKTSRRANLPPRLMPKTLKIAP